MPPITIKIEAQFKWGEQVRIISNPEEPTLGVVTELKCSDDEIQYLVASGFDEKYCFANELELVSKREKRPPKPPSLTVE